MDFFADDDTDEVRPSNDDERDILGIYRNLPRRDKHEFMSTIYNFDKRKVHA